jgi:hypothetical protein
MNYLDPSDYEAYGLEAATSQAWVTAASALIDAHCRRPTLAVAQYTERLRLACGRNVLRLSFLPLAALAPATTPIAAARARYATPRRGEGDNLAADVAQTFALPGAWIALDPAALDYSSETGEVTLPANALGLSFNEVEITYTAGFDSVPDAAKAACAQIVRNAQATPALNVRAGSLDRMQLQYFSDTLLDATVRELLAPFVATKA